MFFGKKNKKDGGQRAPQKNDCNKEKKKWGALISNIGNSTGRYENVPPGKDADAPSG